MRRFAAIAILVLAGCARPYVPHAPRQLDRSRASAVAGTGIAVLATDGSVVEGAVAVSPVNASNVIAGGIHYRTNGQFQVETWRSVDAGWTWIANGALPLRAGASTFVSTWDPVLVFDRAGVAYISVIAADANDRWTVVVYRSTDNGATWVGVEVNPGDTVRSDKEWLAADNSGSRFDGSLYLAWATFGSGNGTKLRIARSRDHGATWTEATPVDSGGSPFINVAGDGKVYASHFAGGASIGSLKYTMMRSDDGGVTFGPAADIAAMDVGSPGGTTMHHAAGDMSSRPTRGNTYVVFPSGPAVYFTRSTDGGTTWSQPYQLSSVAALPSVTVDPITGEVTTTWLDRRDDPQLQTAKLWTARSIDGGATFIDSHAVSAPFALTGRAGDYNQIAAFNGASFASFADSGGHLSVARLQTSDGPPPPPPPAHRRAVRH